MALLINIVVFLLLIGCVIWVVDMLPLPPPINTVVRVILLLATLVWVLRAFGLFDGRSAPVLG